MKLSMKIVKRKLVGDGNGGRSDEDRYDANGVCKFLRTPSDEEDRRGRGAAKSATGLPQQL